MLSNKSRPDVSGSRISSSTTSDWRLAEQPHSFLGRGGGETSTSVSSNALVIKCRTERSSSMTRIRDIDPNSYESRRKRCRNGGIYSFSTTGTPLCKRIGSNFPRRMPQILPNRCFHLVQTVTVSAIAHSSSATTTIRVTWFASAIPAAHPCRPASPNDDRIRPCAHAG